VDSGSQVKRSLIPVLTLSSLAVAYVALAFLVGYWRPAYLLTGAVIVSACVIFIAKWKTIWATGRCAFWFFALSLLIIGLIFCVSAVKYPFGTAEERHRGYGMGFGHSYLDRDYRYWHRVYFADPSLLDGLDVLYLNYPNNAGVNCLAILCGPVPGSYSGPFPTHAEAAKLLDEQDCEVRFGEPRDWRIWVDDIEIQINMKRHWSAFTEIHNWHELGVLTAATIGSSCVLLGEISNNKLDKVFVIDANKGDVVAILRPEVN